MAKKKTKRRAPSREAGTIERNPPPLSGKNGKLLLGVAMAVCALPMLLGVRLWGKIPEAVPSGFSGPAGESTISRMMVVFGFPVLICLMDLVAYWELTVLNRRKGPPSAAMRLLGRWGFPFMSVVFCAGMIFQAAGQDLTAPYLLPSVCGLLLMILGSYILDVPDKDASIHAGFLGPGGGKFSLAAGFLLITAAMVFG